MIRLLIYAFVFGLLFVSAPIVALAMLVFVLAFGGRR